MRTEIGAFLRGAAARPSTPLDHTTLRRRAERYRRRRLVVAGSVAAGVTLLVIVVSASVVRPALSPTISEAPPTASSPRPATEPSTATAEVLGPPSEHRAELTGLGVASDGFAWAVGPEGLATSEDGGSAWKPATPPTTSGAIEATFVDATVGVAAWAVEAGRSELAVATSTDGGRTWGATTQVRIPEAHGGLSTLDVEVLGEREAFVAVRHATSSNFSVGSLAVTGDAGRTWRVHDLPVFGDVTFASPEVGWLVGGTEGTDGYLTRDGGRSWAPMQLPEVALRGLHRLSAVGVDRSGTARMVSVVNDAGALEVITMAAVAPDDWRVVERVAVEGGVADDLAVPPIFTVDELGGTAFLVVGQGGSQTFFAWDSGGVAPTRLPRDFGHVVKLAAGPEGAGLAEVLIEDCPAPPSGGGKGEPCVRSFQLLNTEDNGRTWRRIAGPDTFTGG